MLARDAAAPPRPRRRSASPPSARAASTHASPSPGSPAARSDGAAGDQLGHRRDRVDAAGRRRCARGRARRGSRRAARARSPRRARRAAGGRSGRGRPRRPSRARARTRSGASGEKTGSHSRSARAQRRRPERALASASAAISSNTSTRRSRTLPRVRRSGTVTFFLYFDDGSTPARSPALSGRLRAARSTRPRRATRPGRSLADRELREPRSSRARARALDRGRLGRPARRHRDPVAAPSQLTRREEARDRGDRRVDLVVAVGERGEQALVLARRDVDAALEQVAEERRVALGVELLHPRHRTRSPAKSVSIAPTRWTRPYGARPASSRAPRRSSSS